MRLILPFTARTLGAMNPREFDPLRLDVAAFAKDAGQLEGHWPLNDLLRLQDAAHPDADPAAVLRLSWSQWMDRLA
jgi:uncharacterized protein